MKGRVRLGVVGCGAFARFALGAVAGSPLVSLAALADPRQECLREAVRTWHEEGGPPGGAAAGAGGVGVKLVAHGEDVCRDPAVDLVWVLAPPYLHYDLARTALEKGKAVFLEKPGALRSDQMEELADLAERSGVPASVDFVLRRTPLAAAVARLVEEGVLGLPERALLENVAHDEQLPRGHWFWDPSLSGGIFVEHGVHFFDLAGWWFGEGEVRGALALRRTAWEEAPVDRVFCACLHGDPAVLCTHYHSFTTVKRFERAYWRLVFRRGFLELAGWIPVALQGEVLVAEEEAEWLRRHGGCRLEPLEPPSPDREPRWAGARGRGAAGEGPGVGGVNAGGTAGEAELAAGDAPGEGAGRGDGGRVLRYRAHLELEQPDRTATYRTAIREGLEDLAACVLEPGRRPAVTLADGCRALRLAERATRLAGLG